MTSALLTDVRAEPTTGEPVHEPAGRSLPIGAEFLRDGGVHFRVWAPRRQRVEVVFEDSSLPALVLTTEVDGYFAGTAPQAGVGTRYRFRLDDEQHLYPDPASRYQPDGVHGPSEVVDAGQFGWNDEGWAGIAPHGQVLYELHIGTFTPEGTWAAAERELPALAELGITCLEVMPVNEFPGQFGWGYDGVGLFAPFHHYGTPDDFRRFVDRAHQLGIGVILDLVYNHLGPDGNYLPQFSNDYFNVEHHTDWGDAINFDGENSGPVREFYLANARHWITEYHLDGFRFDATQAIVDTSPKHILAEITEQVRAAAATRSIYLINENEPQNTTLVRPVDRGGFGMDAMWNDDFHHSARVALTGRREAYYTDHPGSPQEFISAAKWGYLFQGQRSHSQSKRRGTAAFDLPPTAFVHYLQNHDQIANSGRGYRAHRLASPGELRAMTALLLLMPQTPMLFQGQEWAASSPFCYFANHNPELSGLIKAGRAKELAAFPSVATPAMQAGLANPADEQTFLQSKLDPTERHQTGHAEIYQLHKDLLRLRREDPVFRRIQGRGDVDGAVLGPGAFVLRYFGENSDVRLLIINLDDDLPLMIAPEPLLAPPPNTRWSVLWSSEHPQYGGSGNAPPDTEEEGWFLTGRCALVLKPMPADQAEVRTRIVTRASAQAPRAKTEEEKQS